MKNITLSIVIPLYNESKRLKKTVCELQKLNLPRGIKLEEIIFVNDGSTDATLKSIKYKVSGIMGKKKHAKNTAYSILNTKYSIISYSQNMGKGYALRKGIATSSSDYTLTCDADMSTPLSEINKFAHEMRKGTDVIIGTRKNGHSTVIEHQPLIRESLGKGFTYLTKVTLGIKGTDFTCGFKAFSRKANMAILKYAVINRWAYDAEWMLITQKEVLTAKEIAIKWSNDARTKVQLGRDIALTVKELLTTKKNDILGSYSSPRPTLPAMTSSTA